MSLAESGQHRIVRHRRRIAIANLLDVELHGGKRGFLEHARARFLYALGFYGGLRDVNWAAVDRLVFVCAGNICRSPYAGARARSLGAAAASFGLLASGGAPADPVASRNALLRGMDLSEHRSAKAESSLLARNDLIIVFEPGHVAEIRRLTGGGVPVSLLGVWSPPVRPHIQDPYGRSDRYFQECFSVIDANVAVLVGHLASHRQRGAESARPIGYDKDADNGMPI